MKIINLEPNGYSEEAKSTLSKIGEYIEDENPNIYLKKECEILILRIGHFVDSSFLDQFHNLKIIGTNVTGIDHIDIDECKKRNIKVISLRDNPDMMSKVTASAEFTVALILMMARKIPQSFQEIHHDAWDRYKYNGLLFNELQVGIVGNGRNGKQIDNMLSALGVSCKNYDNNHKKKNSKSVLSINELLTTSNVVVLCVDYKKENIKFFDRNLFNKMQKNSIFINTSRGCLIDEVALIEALSNQKISSAAVDVIEDEKNPKMSKLIKYTKNNNNLLITQHIAGCVPSSWKQTEEIIANMIFNHLK